MLLSATKCYEVLRSASNLRFMSLVQRRRVCMMHFIGPRESKLRLLPRDGRPAIELQV